MAKKPPPKKPGAAGNGPSGNKGPGGQGPVGKGPSGKGRQSVAAARRAKSGSNRTQIIIGAVAIVLIIAVVVIGIVLNRKQTAVQGDGYGTSKTSTATVAAGIITFTGGSTDQSIDVFEDALCPICAEFETQFGQQTAQAVDQGQLDVRLHMLNFLNASSPSKDYSTRAYAALLAVATDAGSTPGLAMKFHSALFDAANQPAEGGSSDLSNAQLADLASKTGAPDAVKAEIAAGKYVELATTTATSSSTALQTATGRVATPTVLHDGAPVATNSSDWLTTLLGA